MDGFSFSNGDLVREDRFSEDFDAKFLQVPGDKGEDVFVIEMIPKPDTPVVWGKIISKMLQIMFQWKFPIMTKMER